MASPASLTIVLASTSKKQCSKALALSKNHSLPLHHEIDDNYLFHFVYTDNRVELQYNPSQKKSRTKPLFVNFIQKEKLHSRIRSSSVRDPLARAVGLKAGYRPTVLDVTAGLGVDGLTLAYLGCKVILVERSPLVHALLEDGLRRMREVLPADSHLRFNPVLHLADSILFLKEMSSRYDVVFLDPMYPMQTKGPQNKKEMRFLRHMVGDDLDAELLAETAFHCGIKRIVVKRPKSARPLLPLRKPSHQTAMKSGRFDIYFP